MNRDSTQIPDGKVSPAFEEVMAQARRLRAATLESVGRLLVGLEEVTSQLLIALLADGHVLMEGVPGTAKTTLCKTFAQILGIEFQRIQFTPDLLPSDVTGMNIYDRNRGEFVLRKGPIFCQILLGDEVNRAPAKTQSALLEAMQEYQVTIEGTTLPLPKPFMVLATQNPVEQEGVYRLPEAQLDRFLIRVEVGYPDRAGELDMLELHSQPAGSAHRQPQKFNGAMIRDIQGRLHEIHGAPELRGYIIDLVRASRQHPDIVLGASPRAAIFLMRAARARAMLDGRVYFTHDDVQRVALLVLGHRLILRPESEVEGQQVSSVVQELVESVPVTPRKSR